MQTPNETPGELAQILGPDRWKSVDPSTLTDRELDAWLSGARTPNDELEGSRLRAALQRATTQQIRARIEGRADEAAKLQRACVLYAELLRVPSSSRVPA